MATAVGGGTLRDVMLERSPFWMTQWEYLGVVALSLAIFIVFHKWIQKIASTLFIFDTIGLALFTVVGYEKTIDAGFPFWTAWLMGMSTGAAGGVIRDILINEVPLIFRHDIYALACLVGGLVYTVGMWLGLSDIISQLGCAVSVILVRVFAVRYHWQLPTLRDEES